jgi:hypothetical protein
MSEKQKCAICGEFFPEHDMVSFFTGRKKYACPTCWNKGDKESAARISIGQTVRRRIRKYEESK